VNPPINPVVAAIGRPFRLAMVGGAPPSMIGPVHRGGATLDGRFAIVAGVLSSDPAKGKVAGAQLGIDGARCYADVPAMLAAERQRADGIEAVAVVTPNDSHYAIVRAAAEAGLDVIVDKPLCNDASEADELARIVAKAGVASVVTHTYAGYPMIRQARALVADGAIGELRFAALEYFGSGLALKVEEFPDAHRRWRLRPEKSGASLVLLDLGTHAHHMLNFVAGARMNAVSAEVGTLMPGRAVHDWAALRLRLEGGARGVMTISQAAAGAENHIALRVFGSKGHVEWLHRDHEHLRLALQDGETRIFGKGQPNLAPPAAAAARLARSGHPEGVFEAFAVLYADFADAMLARRAGRPPNGATPSPGVADGAAGVRFVHAALASSAADGRWVEFR
jgi:predicted dehydrogenase